LSEEHHGWLLPALDAGFPGSLLPALEAYLAKTVGATEVQLLLVDYDLETLQCYVGAQDLGMSTSYPIGASAVGRAFISQRTDVRRSAEGDSAYVPITVRGERIGVLWVSGPTLGENGAVATLEHAALTLGYVMPRAALYADTVERTRRQQPLTLPAEIQWSELPVRAHESDYFTVAGQLCPAYEVGGDIFDYTFEDDHLVITSLDAMGHGLNASLLGSLAINTLRNARRAGLSLIEQVHAADRVLFEQFGGEQFVSGAMLRIDRESGEVKGINAGHPLGCVIRDGQVEPLDMDSQLPMGLWEKTEYVEHIGHLQPGDRVIVVSDGVLEACPPGGEEFGEKRLYEAVLAEHDRVPGELVRHLMRMLRAYQGVELRDDLTIICLDWRGGPDPDRDPVAQVTATPTGARQAGR